MSSHRTHYTLKAKATWLNGVLFRSIFESQVARSLELAGVDFKFEATRLTYNTPRIYIADFTLPNGVLVETKGYFPSADRRKMLAVKKAHPELHIHLLFQNAANKIGKSKNALTYGAWATKYHFPWAEGPKVPEARARR